VPCIRQFLEARAAVPNLVVLANHDPAPSPLRLHASCDSVVDIQGLAKWSATQKEEHLRIHAAKETCE
jgi:hypothetical protein